MLACQGGPDRTTSATRMGLNSGVNAKRLVALAVLLALAVFLGWPRRRSPKNVSSPPQAARQGPKAAGGSRSHRSASEVDSVDPQVCAGCHADAVADYHRNGMSHSWQAVRLPLLGESTGNAYVPDALTGYRYQVVVEDDDVWQEETRTDDPEHRLRRKAHYLVGSGNHAQAMVAADNGYLTQMPVAWFHDTHSWQLNPGFELQNHRFDRPITAGCVGCHGTTARHEAPVPNRFSLPIERGIGCRRCHGNAARHVAFHTADGAQAAEEASEEAGKSDRERKSGEAAAADAVAADPAGLVHPARLPPAAANDVCLQCHLQGDVTVYRQGTGPFDFQAGDRLRDHRHDFLIDWGKPASLGVASHGARMLQSRCYIASEGRLTCVMCHDSHKPSHDVAPGHYDRMCASCHTSESCARIRPSEPAGDAAACVECHMPQRPTREGIHLVFTDHAILRNPSPAVSEGDASDVLRPNSDVTLVSPWPESEASEAWLGAAYVLLHESMGPQLQAVARGRQILEEVLERAPGDAESQFWLASAMLAQRRGREAIPLLSALASQHPDWREARFRLAVAYELAGDHRAASSHYRNLIDDTPHWLASYDRLSQLLMSQQRADAAAQVLSKRLELRRDADALSRFALARRLNGATHDAAMEAIGEAIRLDRRLPAAFLNRGILHLLEQHDELARRDFQKVLELDPDNAHAREALQSLDAAK